MKQHLLWVTKVCYRTKIVMVYLLVLKRCINFKYSIRTRIVMVYREIIMCLSFYVEYSYKNCYGLSRIVSGRNSPKTYVFVQELLWFIVSSEQNRSKILQYSYKNCYGLSAFGRFPHAPSPLYSYKNCYGLS